MSRALFEINSEIMACVDAETGEILDGEKLDALQMERDEKIKNVGMYILNLSAEVDALKTQEKKFAERRKAKENKIEGYKFWLANVLDGQAFETPEVVMSFRKSKSVDIKDKEKVLNFLETKGYDDCLKYAEPTISKTEVGRLIKSGVEVDGAEIVETNNLQIK